MILTKSTLTSTVIGGKTGQLAYVDALRGLAIFMVIAFHTAFMPLPNLAHLPPALSALLNNGARGVQLFFVASGFTMFYSLGHRRDTGQQATLSFYLRRFFRIAPLYWAGLVGYSLWFYYANGRTFTLANTAAEVFFLHGLSPYWMNTFQPGGWSVTVEMCFYLFVPLLYRYVTTLNRALVFVLSAMLLNTALQSVLYHASLGHINTPGGWFQWNQFLFCFLPSQLPVFGLGFVLYFLTQPVRKPVKPGVALVVTLVLLGACASGERAFLLPDHQAFGVGFVAIAYFLSKWPHKVLVNPVTRFVGRISFSLYLGHFFIIFILNHYGWGDWVAPTDLVRSMLCYGYRLGLVLLGSVPLAYLLHWAIELPGQRLGQRVLRQLEQRKMRVTAVPGPAFAAAGLGVRGTA